MACPLLGGSQRFFVKAAFNIAQWSNHTILNKKRCFTM